MPVTLRPLGPGHEAAWDRFVEAMPASTFFHRAAWAGVVERAFGHKSCYVLAERDGAVVGVLPLMHVRSLLFGSALVSNPFCVYGGPLAADDEARDALYEHAAHLLARTGARVAEFRHQGPVEDGWAPAPPLYATFRRPIAPDDEANLQAIPRKQRAVVRKTLQGRLNAVVDASVDRLHRVYAESVHGLGTPVFPRRYFRLLAEAFGRDAEVLTVLDGPTPVASVLSFYFRDEVLPYYGGGTHAARHCGGNDRLYWEVMRRAASRGCRSFDFGRSKLGTGAYAFKKNWGFTPAPLHYRFLVAPGASIPAHNPSNPKYRLLIAAWKRLPLPVANVLGPRIVRGLA